MKDIRSKAIVKYAKRCEGLAKTKSWGTFLENIGNLLIMNAINIWIFLFIKNSYLCLADNTNKNIYWMSRNNNHL